MVKIYHSQSLMSVKHLWNYIIKFVIQLIPHSVALHASIKLYYECLYGQLLFLQNPRFKNMLHMPRELQPHPWFAEKKETCVIHYSLVHINLINIHVQIKISHFIYILCIPLEHIKCTYKIITLIFNTHCIMEILS